MSTIDEALGLGAGLYAVAGVSGVGKTTLVSNLIDDYVKRYPKKTVLFCHRNTDGDKYIKNKWSIVTIDIAEPHINSSHIMLESGWVNNDQGLSMIVIDDYRHLHRTDTFNGYDMDDGEKKLCLLGRLKALSEILDIPVVITCDVDDDIVCGRTDKRPQIRDIRDSNYITAVADMIIMLHREEMFSPVGDMKGITECNVIHKDSSRTMKLAFISERQEYHVTNGI